MSLSYFSFAIMAVISVARQGFLSMLISIIPFVLLFSFGAYLIFSSKLPSKMASSMIQEEKTTSFTFQDIQVLAFSIIGLLHRYQFCIQFLNNQFLLSELVILFLKY